MDFRKQFLAEIGHDAGFPHLFDHLDQIAFFLKDRHFQVMYANRHFFQRFGFETEAEIIGKDDFELFPKSLAAKFRQDDERVLKTGEGMARMVELFLNRQGLPDWFITNKIPVLGKNGKPAGIMGTVQRYNRSRGLSSADPSIAEAVKRMLERPGEIISVTELARELQLSHRHFDRRDQ